MLLGLYEPLLRVVELGHILLIRDEQTLFDIQVIKVKFAIKFRIFLLDFQAALFFICTLIE